MNKSYLLLFQYLKGGLGVEARVAASIYSTLVDFLRLAGIVLRNFGLVDTVKLFQVFT